MEAHAATLLLPSWPLLPGGFGGGWLPLVQSLVDDLDLIVPGWTPVQIKERDGALVFRIVLPDVDRHVEDVARARIWSAERISEHVCDVCGHRGTLREIDGWFATRCDTHVDADRPDAVFEVRPDR